MAVELLRRTVAKQQQQQQQHGRWKGRERKREQGNYNNLQRFENSTESMSINEIDSRSPECLSLQLSEFSMGHSNEDDDQRVNDKTREG